MATSEQCENGYNPLYDWCMDAVNNHTTCRSTCVIPANNLNLVKFINSEIRSLSSNNEDLKNKINFYRRTNQNLKKFIEDKTDLANKRNLEILERKDKDTFHQIIGYSILLIIAICFGIFCIYYYFKFK